MSKKFPPDPASYPAYVRALYQSILGRAPESDDRVAAWVSYLTAHGADVTARAIAQSVEGKARLRKLSVAMIFAHVLGRPAEAEAVESLAATRLTLEDLLGGLHASDEYLAKFTDGDAPDVIPPPPPL